MVGKDEILVYTKDLKHVRQFDPHGSHPHRGIKIIILQAFLQANIICMLVLTTSPGASMCSASVVNSYALLAKMGIGGLQNVLVDWEYVYVAQSICGCVYVFTETQDYICSFTPKVIDGVGGGP